MKESPTRYAAEVSEDASGKRRRIEIISPHKDSEEPENTLLAEHNLRADYETCLSDLAWLIEISSSSCASVMLIENKLIISDNDLNSSSKTRINFSHINTLMNYLSNIVNVTLTSAEEEQKVLEALCLQKIKGQLKGELAISFEEDELKKIIQITLKESTKESRFDKPMKALEKEFKDYWHSAPRVAAIVGVINRVKRHFKRIKNFLQGETEDTKKLKGAFRKDEDSKYQPYTIKYSEYGALKLEDREWLLDKKCKGYAILLTHEGTVHTELKQIDLLLVSSLLTKDSEDGSFYLGISKLCCFWCYKTIEIINKEVFSRDVITVTGTHGQKHDNWKKNLPIFLMVPNPDGTGEEKGLHYCKFNSTLGYLTAYKNSLSSAEPTLIPISVSDDIDKKTAALAQTKKYKLIEAYLYRDYRLVEEIRNYFTLLVNTEETASPAHHVIRHLSPISPVSSSPSDDMSSTPSAQSMPEKNRFVLTAGGGDCAFHACLGEPHEEYSEENKALIYRDDSLDIHRKQLGEAVIRINPTQNPHTWKIIQSGIKESIMNKMFHGKNHEILHLQYEEFCKRQEEEIDFNNDNFSEYLNAHPSIKKYIFDCYENKSGKSCENLLTALNYCINEIKNFSSALGEKFVDPRGLRVYKNWVDRGKKEFDWEKALAYEKIATTLLTEYANYLAGFNNWLLPLEVQLIALIFKKNILFYNAKNEEKYFYGTGEDPVITVRFNGSNHYERVMPDDKSTKTPALLATESTSKTTDKPDSLAPSSFKGSSFDSQFFKRVEPQETTPTLLLPNTLTESHEMIKKLYAILKEEHGLSEEKIMEKLHKPHL